ncbi:hypothetical protein GOBAR_DD14659 [Gossypium barbadense]|nr:hypothetical protein GOBAR_DD14659 [Gossypium barbadense]
MWGMAAKLIAPRISPQRSVSDRYKRLSGPVMQLPKKTTGVERNDMGCKGDKKSGNQMDPVCQRFLLEKPVTQKGSLLFFRTLDPKKCGLKWGRCEPKHKAKLACWWPNVGFFGLGDPLSNPNPEKPREGLRPLETFKEGDKIGVVEGDFVREGKRLRRGGKGGQPTKRKWGEESALPGRKQRGALSMICFSPSIGLTSEGKSPKRPRNHSGPPTNSPPQNGKSYKRIVCATQKGIPKDPTFGNQC